MFNLYLKRHQKCYIAGAARSPSIVYRLDDEPKCWANIIDVLIQEFLDYGRFASIVQSSAVNQHTNRSNRAATHSINTRISLSFRRALRRMESIVPRHIGTRGRASTSGFNGNSSGRLVKRMDTLTAESPSCLRFVSCITRPATSQRV